MAIALRGSGLVVRSQTIDEVDSMPPPVSGSVGAEYVQLEAGALCARWTTVTLPSMIVQFAVQRAAVLRFIRIPSDSYAFMIPLDVPASARWNGCPVAQDAIIVCPPASGCFAFDPRDAQFAIVTMPFFESAFGDRAEPMTVHHRSADWLRAQLLRLRGAAERKAGRAVAFDDDLVAASLEAWLPRGSAAFDRTKAHDSRNTIVGRADAFFRDHASEGVSVTQLSSVAGVSERSLRNAFYEVFTTGPKRYMSVWRLNQVRRALLRADGVRATVTNAATSFGFYELGRFSGAYKSLFGETPSKTLGRASGRRFNCYRPS